MTKNEECVCMICGKRLDDKKIPICLRCGIEIRNKTGKTIVTVTGSILSLLKIKELLENNDEI